MGYYRYCSFNVRGIRDYKKRRKLFCYFHKHNFDFILLQETHSNVLDCTIWSAEWGGKLFLSHGTNASRGVPILIKAVLTLNVINTYIDCEGRYIILNIDIEGTTLDIVNVYGHNLDTDVLFSTVGNHFNNHDWAVASMTIILVLVSIT